MAEEIGEVVDARKLYVVYSDESHNRENVIYAIYALELSKASPGKFKESIPLPEPILTLPADVYPYAMGFGVLSSKIYMVGQSIASSLSPPQLNVYIFDTDNPAQGLTPGPPLDEPINSPIVIRLDGKLYVMPRFPDPKHGRHQTFMAILDPSSSEWWTKVPLPAEMWEKGRETYKYENINPYRVTCHAVRGNEILFSLRMSKEQEDKPGVLVFNTENNKWKMEPAVGVHKQLSYLPFYEDCFFWGDIWGGRYSNDKWLKFYDSRQPGEEDNGCHVVTIPRPPSYEPPVQEEARVIELDNNINGGGGGSVLVLSSCLKTNRNKFTWWVHLRVDFLGLSFKRNEKDDNKVHIDCDRLRSVCFKRGLSFRKELTAEMRMSARYKGMIHACFLI